MDFDFSFEPKTSQRKLSLVPSGPRFERPDPSAALPSYIQSLNDRQKEAALAVEGPLMVLAGAGSGKTKMLTARMAYLTDACGVPAHQILAVTFTNKAAQEMRERVERMLAGDSGYSGLGVPEIGTFHSVCVRILRREAARTPFNQPFVIYDDADQLALLKGVVEKLGIDEKSFNPKGFQAAINRAKCEAIEPHEMKPAPHDLYARETQRVYEQYQRDLFANNAVDFGEILCLTYRLLRDHEDLRTKYQQRFQFLHVDEYQDTNRAQYLLLSQLASRKYGGHENICVVGDEDQSIYKWRGADIKNILDFEQDFPGARVVKLEQNYRSTQTIVTAASHVIRNNSQRRDKTLWTENEKGLPIQRVMLADERAEAEMVIGEVKRLARDEGRSYSDFAVFYRTHAQSRQFEDALRRDKIAYQIVGGLRFYDRKEIKDILSYLKAIMNPSDSISLKRVINSPARGIGKSTVDKLDALQAQTGKGYLDVIDLAASEPGHLSTGPARKLQAFSQLMAKLRREQPKLLLSELYHLILDETGYVRSLRQEGTDEASARVENLEELDTLLQEFEENQLEGVPEAEKEARQKDLLPQFIEQSSLAQAESEHGDNMASSVKLMSLHSSKGLEFPVVFLVGMEEGLFPSVRPWEETPDEEIEEERRLCYVGMTRARERLFLSHVAVRRLWGNITYQEPARFFAEIPDEFLDVKDLSYGGQAARFGRGSSHQLQKQWGPSTSDFSRPGSRVAKTNWDDDVAQAPAQLPRATPRVLGS